MPAEVVACTLGMHHATLYRHLPLLKRLGLLDARAHRTTLHGQTVADGTVWSVKLRPHRGRAARVRIEDLKHKWRDLWTSPGRGRSKNRLTPNKWIAPIHEYLDIIDTYLKSAHAIRDHLQQRGLTLPAETPHAG